MKGLEPLFEDGKAKADAVASLKKLADDPGWQLIVKALKLNVQYLSTQLRERKDFNSLEEVYCEQDKIDHLESLQELPAILITEAIGDSPPDDDSDVYGP